MASDPSNEASIFNTARKIVSSDERDAFLKEACGGDDALRGRVRQLLAAYDAESQFLEQPAAELGGTIDHKAWGDDLAASLDAGLAPAFGEEQAVVLGSANHSVLKSLNETIDSVPCVNLREADAEGEDPIVRPSSPEIPQRGVDGRYQLGGEIARGGMGAVLKGRDTDLGRDLAIKVLLDSHKDKPDVIARFIEEAQIGGQLQHPGIAPVYELGQFADKRPFFSMKLVKGKTLAALLKERSDTRLACHESAASSTTTGEPPVATDLPRFLGIFEQVCQTMAYAHSRGVIHRDLKPSNIMVGAFGEVQVMDWGLAKVLSSGGVADEKKARDQQNKQSVIRTRRSEGSSDTPEFGSHTEMGTVMGTPAYMPPEQALGEIDQLDRHADVFGLGAILCEILTGKPPYVGANSTEVFRLASRGKLDECVARLDDCRADQELIALTKHCLQAEPSDRPKDAAAVAEQITGYLESVQTKLKQAEIEAAEAHVRAESEQKQRELAEGKAAAEQKHREVEHAKVREERKRRRVQLTLGLVVLVLLLGAGGVALWYQNYINRVQVQQVQDVEQLRSFLKSIKTIHDEFDSTLRKKAGVFKLQNRRTEWTDKLQRASATLANRGTQLLGRIEGNQRQVMAKQLTDLQKNLTEDQKVWRIVVKLSEIRDRRWTVVGNAFDYKYARDHYPKVFQSADFGLFNDDAKVVARRVRLMRIQDQVIASLYDWALLTFFYEGKAKKPKIEKRHRELRSRLLALIKLLDDSPGAETLHDPSRWQELKSNQEALKQLIVSMPPNASPHVFSLCGELAKMKSAAEKAWLQVASSRYPHDFAINFEIGTRLSESSPLEAIGYFCAAVNINPSNSATYNNWGVALKGLKEYGEAIAKFKIAINLNSNYPNAYTNWGNALAGLKKFDEAFAKYKKANTINPKFAKAYYNWGSTLVRLKKHEEAIAKFEMAAKIDPNDANAYHEWGVSLDHLKKHNEAIAKLKMATNLDPNDANAYYNWGAVLFRLKKYDEAIAKYKMAAKIAPNDSNTYANWGNALQELNKSVEATAKYKMATKFDPNNAMAYNGWGNTLSDLKKYNEAITKYEVAVTINPKYANAYSSWGLALAGLTKHKEAIAKYKMATTIDPNHAIAYNGCGIALYRLKKNDEAIAKYKMAITIDPNYAHAYSNWGLVLAGLKKYDEAIAKYQLATSIDSNYASAYENWGRVLADRKKYTEAIGKYKMAITIDPNNALFYNNMSHALYHLKKYEEATTLLKKAIQLQPKHPNAWYGLGLLCFEQGNFREALASFQMLSKLVPANHPFHRYAQSQIPLCKRWLDREKKLSAVLAKKQQVSAQEQLALVVLCVQYKKRYRDAVTLYQDLFKRKPKLAENLKAQLRSDAACAAALAAAGKGVNADKLQVKERITLRQHALAWLQADLKGYRKALQMNKLVASAIVDQMQHWQSNPDLTTVRANKLMAKLSENEQQAWQKLWTDVQSLEKHARGHFIETTWKGSLTDQKKEQIHTRTMTLGHTYVIEMQSKQFDTYLRLEDDNGKKLKENDDIVRGKTLKSRIIFTPKQEGTYRIVATSFQQSGRGDYTISVREFQNSE